MAEQLTAQQQQAVENRGGTLLVSAAAGSGKTKVLVDRLIRYLTDPIDPANIDDFLIITYTKAAAGELRSKIAAKLTERIAQTPDNRHLQRQLQRLYLTKISTVHAFCGELLREYAYRLELPADFRIAEDTDCQELQMLAMDRVLEQAYEQAERDGDFQAFVDTQDLGRNDSHIPSIVLQVYNSARCHLDPELWLAQSVGYTLPEKITDASETVWGRYLMDRLFDRLDLQIEAMTACANAAGLVPGWENASKLLWENVDSMVHLRESKTWDQVMERRRFSFGTLRFKKNCGDPELEDQIKAVRNACKDELGEKLSCFSAASAKVLADLAASTAAARGMAGLVRRFDETYAALKRSRRMLDFGDLEHHTLELLLGKRRTSPTAAAAEIGARFREILVDEYQDSNEVQDAIFSALTKDKGNLFLVGDVKQSIYQFRLADPQIFLDKYERFVPATAAAPGQGRKVMLSSNFRSGTGVIDAVNLVFEKCMSPRVGGLNYGPEEALREGLPHPSLGEPETELHVIDVAEETGREEAAYTAERIRTLLDGTHMVREGDTLRPIVPDDIVILLRSPRTSAAFFQEALAQRGIQCVSDASQNLLQTEEIVTLRALLQTISNPHQDIPLLAVLASPVFGFTADNLAAIRSKARKTDIYRALCLDDSNKSKCFLTVLAELRREAAVNSLPKLIEKIFSATRMDSVYAAMPEGEARAENLQAFYQLAVGFTHSGRWALDQFLKQLEALEARGLTSQPSSHNAGAVSILSIHKSKGLEYPVVFLCGLSRRFNTDSLNGNILCDKELGIGLSGMEPSARVRYPTLSKMAISEKIKADGLSEELRVLYVAMTRARDRLIMTFASKSLENTLRSTVLRMGTGSRELLTGDVGCPGEWILQAALGRTEAGALFQIAGCRPAATDSSGSQWLICQGRAPKPVTAVSQVEEALPQVPADIVEKLRQGLSFHYAHRAATAAPSKQTATERKGRLKDQEAAEEAEIPKHLHRNWRVPGFVAARTDGTAYGSATHAVLQYIRYDRCENTGAVRREIERLVSERYITPEQGKLADAERLAKFFATPLGKKLRIGQNVIREFKFSILENGDAYGPGLSDEQVMLQGVVDCAMIEPDGITIIDFKTDHVTEETLPRAAERYRLQVEAYAGALSRIYEKPVKSALLYFFHLNRFVELCRQ